MLDYRLSDLSEEEIDNYFHTKEEAKLKGVLWTAMNQDYIEKQALKAALATNSKVRIIVSALPPEPAHTGTRVRSEKVAFRSSMSGTADSGEDCL